MSIVSLTHTTPRSSCEQLSRFFSLYQASRMSSKRKNDMHGVPELNKRAKKTPTPVPKAPVCVKFNSYILIIVTYYILVVKDLSMNFL